MLLVGVFLMSDLDECLHRHRVHVFRTRARAYSSATYGRGSSAFPIWLDNVRCVGNETRLVDCPANLFGQEDCSHYEDACVSCDTRTGRFEGDSI